MKVLRVPIPEPVDFHPQLTVCVGWTDAAVQRLALALSHLPPGAEVEVAGIRFELDETTTAALGLDADDPAMLAGVVDGAGLRRLLEPPEVVVSEGAAVADRDRDDSPQSRGPSALTRRRQDLDTRRRELATDLRILAVSDQPDPEAVAVAIDELESTTGDGGPASPEALELADRCEALLTQIDALDGELGDGERRIREELWLAEGRVQALRSTHDQPPISPDDAELIEAAHAASLEAAERGDSRFGGAKARKAHAEAEAEEQRLLDRFGFATWVDFVMGKAQRAGGPSPVADAELVAAEREVEEATGLLDGIAGATARLRRRQALVARRDELAGPAGRLLGRRLEMDATVPEQLRAGRPSAGPVVTPADVVARLAETGLDLGLTPPPVDEVLVRAREHLAQIQARQTEMSDLEEALAALDSAIDQLDDAQAAGAVDVPSGPDKVALPPLAEPSRGLLALLDEEPPTGDDAEPESLTGRTGEAVEWSGIWDLATDASDGSDGEPELPPLVDRSLVVDDIHWALMGALAGRRLAGQPEYLPLVLVEPFDDLDDDEAVEVVARLARLTDAAQIVLATDRSALVEWARAVGPEHAAVLMEGPAPVPSGVAP